MGLKLDGTNNKITAYSNGEPEYVNIAYQGNTYELVTSNLKQATVTVTGEFLPTDQFVLTFVSLFKTDLILSTLTYTLAELESESFVSINVTVDSCSSTSCTFTASYNPSAASGPSLVVDEFSVVVRREKEETGANLIILDNDTKINGNLNISGDIEIDTLSSANINIRTMSGGSISIDNLSVQKIEDCAIKTLSGYASKYAYTSKMKKNHLYYIVADIDHLLTHDIYTISGLWYYDPDFNVGNKACSMNGTTSDSFTFFLFPCDSSGNILSSYSWNDDEFMTVGIGVMNTDYMTAVTINSYPIQTATIYDLNTSITTIEGY